MPKNGDGDNLGWKQLHKDNALKLVKALLRLAQEQSELEEPRPPKQIEAKWSISETRLEVTGRRKDERNKNKTIYGTKPLDLAELVERYGESLESAANRSDAQKNNKIRNIRCCLEVLEIWEDKTKPKNAQTRIFDLKFPKLPNATTDDYLAWVEKKWDEYTGKTPPPSNSINWHQVCHAMLNKHPLRLPATGRYRGHEAEIDLVPLGLVKPSRQPIRDEDFSPRAAEGTQQYRLSEKEIERQFEENEFFKEIIEQKRENFAIVGEPGAGKSTWLAKIAKYLDQKSNPYSFPICIPLGNLQGKTLENYLRQIWLKNALTFIDRAAMDVTNSHETKLHELFNSGKVWLLLDGADEMQGAGSELPLQQIANQLGDWIGKARVVISCRLNVWETNDKALRDFKTYLTLDFEQAGVADFIKQWFTKDGKPKLGEKLQAKLAEPEKDRIRDLVKNPLRLSLLCKIWDDKEDLPETKAGLYQRLRENFYKWKEKEFPTSWRQRQELNARLAKLALAALERKMPLRESLCYEVMGEDWFKLAKAIGWLNDVYKDAKTDDSVYAFFHLTFQEYFAALAVEDWHDFLTHVPNDLKQKRIYRIFEPQWKEVILLWLGSMEVPAEQKEEFITSLVEFEDGGGDFYDFRAYFLAAAGITEFRDYSKSEEIVRQIVKWGFGYFNSENQVWHTYLDPIEKEAREVLPQTQRSKVINALVELIRSSQFKCTRYWAAAETLGKIDPGNSYAITTLVQLTRDSQDELTCSRAAESLGKIGTGNSDAINALVQLIGNSHSEYTRRIAVESLGKIGVNNSNTIFTLLQIVCDFQDESNQQKVTQALEEFNPKNSNIIPDIVQLPYNFQNAIPDIVQLPYNFQNELTRRRAAESLGKINPGNSNAITTLEKLIDNSQDELARWKAAINLRKVDPGNYKAITTLEKLIDNFKDEDVLWRIAESLGKVDHGNSKAITTLVELIDRSQDESTRSRAGESLGEIGIGNSKAITALIKLIDYSQDEYTRRTSVESLRKIGIGNCDAITALVKLMNNSQDEYTRMMAAASLGKINPGNSNAITTLVQLINNSQSESIRSIAAASLGKINPDNSNAIATLVQLINNSQSEQTRRDAAASLKPILATEKPMAGVVSALKPYLSHETLENNFYLFKECYKVIWHCAQNLPYPTFYKAWHTGILQRNLAQLPQLLNAALVETELIDSVQLICIDGSNFFDQDNPILEIYDAMLDSGCLERSNGEPATMSALKLYYKSLCRNGEKRPILLFYQNPAGAPPQGFSETFLNALSKFDGGIGVVSDQANIPLQSFSPNQPNLIADIVGWIRGIVMES